MNERDFVYWLQGFFEISGSEKLTEQQVQIIKDHIKVCIEKQNNPFKMSPSSNINPMYPFGQFQTTISPLITC